MSQMGHLRPSNDVLGMSAYPPTPDVLLRCRERSKRAKTRRAIGSHSRKLDPVTERIETK